MSDSILSPPGFFGKLPVAGDFVQRGLPADFVAFWDSWVSRHLARRSGFAPLCFLHPATPVGAMSGVVVPSRDRSSRCFPLTIAARCPPGVTVPVACSAWHAALLVAGEAAARGDLSADALATRLEEVPAPPVGDSTPARCLLLWRPGQIACETKLEEPEAILNILFATIAEAG